MHDIQHLQDLLTQAFNLTATLSATGIAIAFVAFVQQPLPSTAPPVQADSTYPHCVAEYTACCHISDAPISQPLDTVPSAFGGHTKRELVAIASDWGLKKASRTRVATLRQRLSAQLA